MLSFLGALWNLVLAAIPLGIIVFLGKKFDRKKWRKDCSCGEKWLFVVLFIIFLGFFPNIPYIFTDVRHILDHCTQYDFYKRCFEAAWSIPLLFTYSVIIIPVFVFAVEKTAILLGVLFHKSWKTITPFVLLPLAALGVCLGMFERWNSWNALTHPGAIIWDGIAYFSDIQKFAVFMAFTLSFLVIFFLFRLWKKSGF